MTEMDQTDLMTGYELRLAKGKRKSAADLLKDEKMVATAVRDVLGVEVERRLESGEVVNIPLAYDLVIDYFGYLKKNPGKIDLKVLSAVLGETKVEVSTDKETASDVFGGIAVKRSSKDGPGT